MKTAMLLHIRPRPSGGKAEVVVRNRRTSSALSLRLLELSLGGALEKVFTQRRVIRQARGASERFLRFISLVEQLQQMSARGPIGLVVGDSAGGNLIERGESGGRLARLGERNGSPNQ
jgi:hypothetical protein